MNELYKQEIGKAIAAKRNSLGISKTRFSLMVGINRGTLKLIEQGVENASLEMLLRIAQGLGVSLADLTVECERSLQDATDRPAIPPPAPRDLGPANPTYFLTQL